MIVKVDLGLHKLKWAKEKVVESSLIQLNLMKYEQK